jgi:flavin reductase (DIM6/NTAB) family NADH-FMN oxidoreductase RutF
MDINYATHALSSKEPGSPHSVIDPSILYWGTPVVLISTTNRDGSANLAPMSSAFWLGTSAVLGLGLSSHTAANLLRTRECVLNLPSADQANIVDRLALTTGSREVTEWKKAAGYRHHADKFALAGVDEVPSELVSSPRVAQTPVAMEATLTSDHITDMHLLTVQISRVHVQDSIRMDGHPNRIDPDRWRPLIMSFQHFYGLGAQVLPSRLAAISEESYRR